MIALIFCDLAHAGGGLWSGTELRTERGTLSPAISVIADPPQPDADPPDPDLVGDGRIQRASLRVDDRGDYRVLVGVAEADVGVEAVYYVPSDGSDRVLVSGRDGGDKFLPPGPCRDGDLPPGPCRVQSELPPGPCFELLVVFGDGSTVNVDVAIQTTGYIDPGSLVGFNPQPDPPGTWREADPPSERWIEVDLHVTPDGDAALDASVGFEQGGELLQLR